ncbi:holin-associated N-acetylmuramidase [Acidimangrovimonas sediminis]|uniref:holin-associated N-acetylmuramidase n=1 Tax=Acidimangrovimonas sediminis TaxID=2056283 RepID=UPI000C7FEB74|nr:holin-associated N-acetylmuramidase [Acidimangrovimonas sediminis]
MPTVEEIAAEIVAREGGYVDDPDDPGGATKYGVTLETMTRLGIDLTGDGRIDTSDLDRLTKAQAIDIFVRHYFREPGLDGLPGMLQPSVFDMYVNAGANAVRILQRLLTEMGFACDDDGVIGPRTRAQARAAAAAAPGHVADAYAIARRNYYFRLADARPASRKYARARDGSKGGWILRAESFMAPRYRLSETAFRERTAGWA